MGELLARFYWMAVLTCTLAFVIYLLFGSLFIVEQRQPVIIRDALAKGQHTMSGMVMVPTPCDELTVRTGSVSPTVYTLELHTWQDPSLNCPKNWTPRAFHTIAFAPALGIQFIVYLDGQTVPFDLKTVFPNKKP
ncbi:MAG: hypothetical protein Q8R25_03875 [bacterium]|nr:hypothetical protein [bacterium]